MTTSPTPCGATDEVEEASVEPKRSLAGNGWEAIVPSAAPKTGLAFQVTAGFVVMEVVGGDPIAAEECLGDMINSCCLRGHLNATWVHMAT